MDRGVRPLNDLLLKLRDGDLRSDGRADEVAGAVLRDQSLLGLLMEGLSAEEDVVRGRTAHALEKVSRGRRDLFRGCLPRLARIAVEDDVAMVRWHLALMLGHLAVEGPEVEIALHTLLALLDDQSIFVKSWSMVSLTIIGNNHQRYSEMIASRIGKYGNHPSVAIRAKVRKSLGVLKCNAPLPTGWMKTTIG